MDKEVWKNIYGYEGYYQVSSMGRVRSFKKKGRAEGISKNPIILNPKKSGNGYKKIYLWNNGKYDNCLIHRLVASAFIPNPENKPTVNHKDNNGLNNHVKNLEWCTYKENTKHAVENGYMSNQKGSGNYSSKLTEKEVLEIREMYQSKKLSKHKIADIFSVSWQTVHLIATEKTWTHV